VLNREDAGCRELAERLAPGVAAWYGLGPAAGAVAWVEDGRLRVEAGPVLPIADVPLPGRHMLLDVLAAVAGATLAGAGPEAAAAAIRGFPGVPHRLEPVGEWRGIRFVNDSQATIPLATLAALSAFDPAPVILVAGGQGKGLDYAELADTIAARCRGLVLIGESAERIERLVADRVPVRRAGSMDEAVRLATGLAQPGDVVILSPAAASFDMFTDYAARGDAFRAAVAELQR
jgi:UDP-N-acetylmuramoylalanine--D-glutamate ligase